jgi:hypothetical protein
MREDRAGKEQGRGSERGRRENGQRGVGEEKAAKG